MRPMTIDTVPLPAAMWHVSGAGYALLKRFEGLRLDSYDDGAGIRTIGWGHVQDEREPSRISPAQAEALLKLDALKALKAVRTSVTIRLWQCEVDALVSLVFNIGSTAFITSHLLKAVNAKDYDRVKAEWLRWDKIGRKKSKGLHARRVAELALFCEVPF